MVRDKPITPRAALVNPVRRAPVARKTCPSCGKPVVFWCEPCRVRMNVGYARLEKKFRDCRPRSAL